MKTIFVVTNDQYANSPVEGTEGELQKQFESLNREPGWNVKLVRRIGGGDNGKDILIDENNNGEIVAEEKRQRKVYAYRTAYSENKAKATITAVPANITLKQIRVLLLKAGYDTTYWTLADSIADLPAPIVYDLRTHNGRGDTINIAYRRLVEKATKPL